MYVWLQHGHQVIPLSTGECLVGRARGCRLRFDDLTVSRIHLRLVVTADSVTVEDLNSQAGTFVNGVRLGAPARLEDGDTVELGHQRFFVRTRSDHDEWQDSTEPVGIHATQLAGQSRANGDLEDVIADSPTRILHEGGPGADAHSSGKTPSTKTGETFRALPTLSLGALNTASSLGAERRRHLRIETELAGLYTSNSLSFRGVIRDVSVGGLFISGDVLDTVGTPCELEIFPSGHCTIAFSGVVRHVVAEPAGKAGRPPGIGIEFVNPDSEAANWLAGFIASHAIE